MIVRSYSGHDVDVGGDVWTFYRGQKKYVVDWTTVGELPQFLVRAARSHAIYLLRTGAESSVMAFFRGSICPLLRCPSAQRPTEALTERVFDELRMLIPHDKANLQRFRKFYRRSVRLPGFDLEASEVMDSIEVGQHRAPPADQGRNPPLNPEQTDFLRRQLALHRDLLPLDGRVAVGYSLALGPNADPMSLARGGDLSEGESGPTFGVPQHKKKHRRPRAELRYFPIDVPLAEDMRLLAKHNAEQASEMEWPDGTVGLPRGVAVPLFMLSRPKPSHAAADCPEREFALHMTAEEVSALIRATVLTLCSVAKADPIHMTARSGKRTLLTDGQRNGLPAAALAFAGGHQDDRHVNHYAAEGFAVLDHVERALGDRLVDLVASYSPVAPKLAGTPDEITAMFRKTAAEANDD